MKKVVKAFEEALFWLKRFQENPEDSEADMKVVKTCERAIKEYIKWIYMEEKDYEGLCRLIARLLKR